MIRVKIYDTEILRNQEVFISEYEKMPAYRREKIDRMKPEASKRQSLGAGILIKGFMDEEGLSPEDIIHNEFGKPLVKDEKRKLFFSVSHAGNYAVIAYGRGLVGIDIERTEKFKRFIPEMVFTKEEMSCIKSLKDDEKADFCCRLWVIKEAVSKAEGSGISIIMDGFSVLDRNNCPIKKLDLGEGIPELFCREYENAPNGYHICVCSEFPETSDLDFYGNFA